MNQNLTNGILKMRRMIKEDRINPSVRRLVAFLASTCCALLFSASALAHGVASGDKVRP